MPWNWELPNWPNFSYDSKEIAQKEKKFLLSLGNMCALLKNIDKEKYDQFVVEILSSEGEKSSKIEGEVLNRDSLQSSIKQHFGLKTSGKIQDKEASMAKLLCCVYNSFNNPLSHETLCEWHSKLFASNTVGVYRTHQEPMQIVSNKHGSTRVFFEAPPSKRVKKEMTKFIEWFNSSKDSLPILVRASIAHLYFEAIHPFEDGNGRIGRILVEKVLSQDRKSTRLNSSHSQQSRMPSSA